MQLPGGRHDGGDPDGYMPKDEIVAYLEGYAAGFAAPVREGVEVVSLRSATGGGFVLRTSAGDLGARSVVITTEAYQRPHRPAGADSLPASLPRIDVEQYRNPQALPPGKMLVVGSGQSGVQRCRPWSTPCWSGSAQWCARPGSARRPPAPPPPPVRVVASVRPEPALALRPLAVLRSWSPRPYS